MIGGLPISATAMQTLKRRQFLKGLAAGASGAALAGMGGMAARAQDNIELNYTFWPFGDVPVEVDAKIGSDWSAMTPVSRP